MHNKDAIEPNVCEISEDGLVGAIALQIRFKTYYSVLQHHLYMGWQHTSLSF